MQRRTPGPAVTASGFRARISRQRRRDAVLRVLQGEDQTEVCRSLGVSSVTLASWQAEFEPAAKAPGQSLQDRPDDASGGTRQAVMRAALQEFAQKGLAGARIDEIAASAGVNKTALYYHFGNKDSLFAAALEHGYAEFRLNERSRTGGTSSALAGLEQLFGAVFDSLHANRQHASLIADENRHGGRHLAPALRKRIQESVDPVIRDLNELIARGQREGVLLPGLDVPRIYLSMISLSMFYLTHASTLSVSVGLDLSDKEEVARWREHVVAFLLLALRGTRRA